MTGSNLNSNDTSTAACPNGNSTDIAASTGFDLNSNDTSTAACLNGNSNDIAASTGSDLNSNDTSTAACLNGNSTDIAATRVREPIQSNVIDVSVMDHYCMHNYDGSSGGMESEGLLLLMHKLYKKHSDEVFLDTIVIDDDTQMKKFITHSLYRPRGWKNHGGSLPPPYS